MERPLIASCLHGLARGVVVRVRQLRQDSGGIRSGGDTPVAKEKQRGIKNGNKEKYFASRLSTHSQPGAFMTPWCCAPSVMSMWALGPVCWQRWITACKKRMRSLERSCGSLRHVNLTIPILLSHPEKLSALAEADCIVAPLELGDTSNLLAHVGHLLVQVAKVGGPDILGLGCAGGDAQHEDS